MRNCEHAYAIIVNTKSGDGVGCKQEKKMRQQKYTKTIAVRGTEDEWKCIQYALKRDNLKNPSEFIRRALEVRFRVLTDAIADEAKREEARARRAAKKAEAANVNA